ncbi:hypothetical protein F442_21494 [Phytophthora nicotianae P10297]|uniref:RxLR effector protein n=2 Tax=Phytophthora nicotianae TaxID=4792 RepID=V9DWX5_PHYNI|nr:hypothetical protein F443_21639 [Phytophthora nicotianae P1569]ETP29357.1 hypothetical protein F442_21494 [Phytophthora nicotianae P10297]
MKPVKNFVEEFLKPQVRIQDQRRRNSSMKLLTLILALVCLSQLGGSSANQATDIMRRQLRVGKAVASLFENQHQTTRELEEKIMQDEDNKPNEVQADASKFRVRRLRSPDYVELIE